MLEFKPDTENKRKDPKSFCTYPCTRCGERRVFGIVKYPSEDGFLDGEVECTECGAIIIVPDTASIEYAIRLMQRFYPDYFN